MIVIDLDADLNAEDDHGLNVTRRPDGDAPEPGAVLVAGRGDFWSWAVVHDVDDAAVRFRQITAKEAAARLARRHPLTREKVPGVQTVFVDYSLYGHSRTVATALYPEQQENVAVGIEVRVTGDDVADRRARLISLSADRREAVLELLEVAHGVPPVQDRL